jgi:hypothetical protein
MNGAELESARKRLKLSAADLGRRLYLIGRDPGQSVRLWETNRKPVPGPVRCAVELMLQAAKSAQAKPLTAIQPPPAAPQPEPIPAPVDPLAICSETVASFDVQAQPWTPPSKSRRRG